MMAMIAIMAKKRQVRKIVLKSIDLATKRVHGRVHIPESIAGEHGTPYDHEDNGPSNETRSHQFLFPSHAEPALVDEARLV